MGTTPDIHGYTNWDSKVPSEPYSFEVQNNIFPTIFQAQKLDKPNSEIGMFCQWAGILYLVDTLSINHYSHMPMAEYDHRVFTDSITSYLKSYKPILCTIVFDDPDHTGHKDYYFSNEYYKVLEDLDDCITRIVMSVKDAGYYDDLRHRLSYFVNRLKVSNADTESVTIAKYYSDKVCESLRLGFKKNVHRVSGTEFGYT